MTLLQRARAWLDRRAMAYRSVFNGPDADIVLKDLAKFCRANESTFHENERIAGMLDGRREVWLRIQRHLNLSDEQLWEIHGVGQGKNE